MPLFRYQAVNAQGRNLRGVMPAQNETELERKLKDVGLWLMEAVEEAPADTGVKPQRQFFIRPVNGKKQRRELTDFCMVMTFQLRAGIPLPRALGIAAEDCLEPAFRMILRSMQAQIETGLQFHEVLANHPRIFSRHFVSVVRAGELTGKLPDTFVDLKLYTEWTDRLAADVRQATLYPVIILVVISAFTLFLFSFVIPKFAVLLDKLHVPQPWLTQVVFTAADVVKSGWWIWCPGLVFLGLVVPLGRRFSKKFALKADQLKLRLPVFGPLNAMLALSRLMHNLALIYRSGVPIIQALELCRQGLIGNQFIDRALGDVGSDIKSGSTISEALRRHPVFSTMLVRMVAIGETTGNLDHALENVASYYNEVIPRRIKTVFGILEPALMLFLIALVGVVALAIYLPILSLMGAIH